VTGIFKQKNSINNLLLLIYGLALKFNLFLHPEGPKQFPEDHFLYTWLINFLKPLNLPPVVYVIFAFALLYSQANLFNRVCNDQKLLAKPNYLAGMAFMLVTSLFKEWNYFSAPLLVNSFLIWIYYRLIVLHNSAKPGAAIFNIGLVMGIVTLLYQPALVFVLLIWAALFIMRPFRIQEWLINLLGITTPYYFLAIMLYLSNQWDIQKLMPHFSFGLPAMPASFLTTISIILLVLPFIIGGFFVQANLSKMFIQVRKSWSLLLIYLIISLVLILVEGGDNYVNWMLCAVPLTAFHAAAYFYPSGKIFPAVMHWILFLYSIYILYGINQ
jgi:hypothetical protein